eukprot:SAG22_NODE_1705_length_3771_cov_1.831699_6_plen_69_part_00
MCCPASLLACFLCTVYLHCAARLFEPPLPYGGRTDWTVCWRGLAWVGLAWLGLAMAAASPCRRPGSRR